MARPRKDGMDYFPHDTDACNDEKIEALRMLYGNDGYAFYFILLERIYRTPNFELDVSDAETQQILSRKIEVTPEKFAEMLNTALKWGCFDKKIFEERGVLTSKGIKKRASVVIEKRQKMREKYVSEMERVSDAETQQKLSKNAAESTQSKVKKSNIYTDAFQHLWEYYKSHAQPGCPIGEKKAAFKKYSSLVKEFPEDKIFEHVKSYLESCEQTRTKTKHLVTFLNQHDFDEPVEPIRRQKTQWEIEQEHMQREIDYFRAQQ